MSQKEDYSRGSEQEPEDNSVPQDTSSLLVGKRILHFCIEAKVIISEEKKAPYDSVRKRIDLWNNDPSEKLLKHNPHLKVSGNEIPIVKDVMTAVVDIFKVMGSIFGYKEPPVESVIPIYPSEETQKALNRVMGYVRNIMEKYTRNPRELNFIEEQYNTTMLDLRGYTLTSLKGAEKFVALIEGLAENEVDKGTTFVDLSDREELERRVEMAEDEVDSLRTQKRHMLE